MSNEEKIQEIVNRYYHQDEEYYSQYRYEECDGGEIEFDMKVEIENISNLSMQYTVSALKKVIAVAVMIMIFLRSLGCAMVK